MDNIDSITNMIQKISKMSCTEKIAVSNLYMLQYYNIIILEKDGPGKLKNGKNPDIIYLPFIKNIYYTFSLQNFNIYYNEIFEIIMNSFSYKLLNIINGLSTNSWRRVCNGSNGCRCHFQSSNL